MAVYVDPLLEHGVRNSKPSSSRWRFSCQMYADTLDELHAMARQIGRKRAFFHDSGSMPHYDLKEWDRNAALRRGAVEHSRAEMVTFMRQKCAWVASVMEKVG